MIIDIFNYAIKLKASDIILSPNKNVFLKINGEMIEKEDFGKLTNDVINTIFLQITNKNQQNQFLKNKELDFGINFGKMRFRVNVFGVEGGIGIVFRLIPGRIPNFNELGFLESVKDLVKHRSGIVLVTGSVGSGKSTTLAALLEEINKNQAKHIITIEDPIEFIFERKKSLFEQREVGVDTLNFENGLKYALRQAPDVIMVGEMRDLETFRLALRAAETGSLVFSTLHTAGTSRTIARIIDMFPAGEKEQIRSQLSESLIGVVWQKLLKKQDGNGRVIAYEVLKNNTGVANLIRKGETHKLDSMIEVGRKKEGMVYMKDSLYELYKNKVISEDIYKEELILKK